MIRAVYYSHGQTWVVLDDGTQVSMSEPGNFVASFIGLIGEKLP